MNCPYCKSNNSIVLDTRSVHEEEHGWGKRRVRFCLDCKKKFYTSEWVKKKGEKGKC